MANKLYEESSIRDIADAIRERNESANKYTVAQMGNAVRNLPKGVDVSGDTVTPKTLLSGITAHNTQGEAITGEIKTRFYEGEVVSTVSGSYGHVVLAKDALLAEHRSDKYLFIRVEFIIEPTAYTVFSTWTHNIQQFIPINNNQPRQIFRRWGSDSALSYNNTVYPVYDDTEVGVGVGRVYITEDGELRCYSNSGNYAIRPCKYRVVVEWEDNYVI